MSPEASASCISPARLYVFKIPPCSEVGIGIFPERQQ